MRKSLQRLFILFFAAGVVLLGCRILFFPSESKKNPANEEEEAIPLQDRMDLAMQYEFEITKEVATNTVPRERLIAAKEYALQTLQPPKYGSNTTQAAIPGIAWTERGPSNIGGR